MLAYDYYKCNSIMDIKLTNHYPNHKLYATIKETERLKMLIEIEDNFIINTNCIEYIEPCRLIDDIYFEVGMKSGKTFGLTEEQYAKIKGKNK